MSRLALVLAALALAACGGESGGDAGPVDFDPATGTLVVVKPGLESLRLSLDAAPRLVESRTDPGTMLSFPSPSVFRFDLYAPLADTMIVELHDAETGRALCPDRVWLDAEEPIALACP